MEARDDPAPRLGGVLQKPFDGLEQVPVLPRHPQAVADEDPVKDTAVPLGQGRGQLTPGVALDLDGGGEAGGGGGRELGAGVAHGVGAEVGDDGRGRVVGQDDAGGAEQGGQQGGQGGAGAQLQDREAGDVEGGEWRAVGARDAALVGAQAEGAGLDKLGQQQRGVPEVVAEEAAVVVAARVC